MLILRILRKVYFRYLGNNMEKPLCTQDQETVSKLLFDTLVSKEPCMIARFGANELATCVNYLGVKNPQRNIIGYIKGSTLPWWWNKNHIEENMYNCAGFFPSTIEKIEQFCELMLEDMKLVDILGSWLPQEKNFENQISKAFKVPLIFLDPYWSKIPWTSVLKGKKVLVIHPFDKTINSQYKKRKLLFKTKVVLPEFKLITIKAVQSLGGSNEFGSWFDALDYMKEEIDKIDFEVCLIGAGAYGFPLAAYIKRIGKKAFHLGGSLQLLFGIKGSRWENENYAAAQLEEKGKYSALLDNPNWVYPSDEDKPINYKMVENGCYWDNK